MTSITDIAAEIRRVSPGVLPESVDLYSGCVSLFMNSPVLGTGPLPDDIAESVLRDAMVMDAGIKRCIGPRWFSWRKGICSQFFDDADHGGSLGSCYAAWRWAKGIGDAT